jgi:hypothetical protein
VLVKVVAEGYAVGLEKLRFFKLWLVLFPILNGVDIVQTWFFFEHESNPLYVLFPGLVFGIKICWSCVVPAILFVSYSKKPRIIYGAAFALAVIYLAVVLFNLLNIVQLLSS